MVDVGALLTAERLSELASHGYPVGLAELDDLTRGLLPEALWVVLGISGVGRTVFACQIAAGSVRGRR
jgi:replicative DNA helicase